MFFVVPHSFVFVQFALIELVEKSKWSWLIYFLSLFMRFLVLITMIMLCLSKLDTYIVTFLLFHLMVNCDINTVWIVLGGFVVFGFEAGLAEQTFDIFDTSLKFDGFEVYFLESLKQFCLSNFGHMYILKIINKSKVK